MTWQQSGPPWVVDITAPEAGTGSGLDGSTYTAAELEALAVSGTALDPEPENLPRLFAASDDATRIFLVSSTSVAQEMTVLPKTSVLTPVAAGAVSDSSPTHIFTDIDALDWDGMTIEVDLLTGTALTLFALAYKQTSAGSYVQSHGVDGYVDDGGKVVDDGFIRSISAPRDPNVLAAGETASIRINTQGIRYWRLSLQSSAAGTANVRVTLWRAG